MILCKQMTGLSRLLIKYILRGIPMDDNSLLWTMEEKHQLLHTPIFDVESMHMRWAPNADAALKDALKIVGEKGTVTVIPDGVGVIL